MQTKRFSYPKVCLSGAATGFVNGFFGAGGGMVLIPLLTRFCKVEDQPAFASSIAIVLPICLTSLAVYALQGSFYAEGVFPYLIGGFAGGIVGGLLFRKVPVSFLHKALGAFILWGGFRLLLT